MSRPFALIGFVYLAVQAVSIYFGSGFAFLASGCFFLLFSFDGLILPWLSTFVNTFLNIFKLILFYFL